MTDKVHNLASLGELAAQLRSQGKTVGLCHGTFDLLHIGHVRHLQRAAQEVDHLFVTVTADEYVNKGPGRPVFPEQLRAEHLGALDCVTAVAVNPKADSINVIDTVKPDVYIKGGEYRNEDGDVSGHITIERKAVERNGGRLFLTDELTFSSTKLLNEHFEVFTPEQKAYLEELGQVLTPDLFVERVRTLRGLKVLVVGDAIVDEYHYTSPLGQSGKSNILAVKYENKERFAGGSIAVANHIAGFADDVTLLAGLGRHQSQEDFIRESLNTSVKPEFLYFEERPTVVKRRYVDGDMNKLFEVYFFDDSCADPAVDQQAAAWLQKHAADYDLVVVPDFGNGFIGPRMIEAMCGHARFLAVNTQLNSGNRGYHVATRYPRADLLSLNEPELRMAAHDRHGELPDVGRVIAEQMQLKALAITRGRAGVMLLDHVNGQVHEVPALSTRVVDRIGAGDAFLSLCALTLAGSEDSRLSAFSGSVAAALDVQIVCNRDSVTSVPFFKYVTTLLK